MHSNKYMSPQLAFATLSVKNANSSIKKNNVWSRVKNVRLIKWSSQSDDVWGQDHVRRRRFSVKSCHNRKLMFRRLVVNRFSQNNDDDDYKERFCG